MGYEAFFDCIQPLIIKLTLKIFVDASQILMDGKHDPHPTPPIKRACTHK